MLYYIRSLVKYNQWANTELIGFLRKLNPALLDKELVSSFNTIRKTLYHVWDAETIWYNRINGTSFTDWPSKSFNGTDNEAFKGFIEQSSLFTHYAGNVNENELMRSFKYRSLEGKEYENIVSDIIIHTMNHSTFHRGQIVTMLRNVGFTELTSTDYISFLRIQK